MNDDPNDENENPRTIQSSTLDYHVIPKYCFGITQQPPAVLALP